MSELTRSLDFGPRLEVAVRSLASPRGAGERENQDNFLLIDTTGRAVFLHDQQEAECQIPDWPAGHARMAVLDGVGGVSGGRDLAQQVVEGLRAIPAQRTQAGLSTLLEGLHGNLQANFPAPTRRPGTTLLLLELPADSTKCTPLLFHVGDSRLYAINDEEVQVLTVDHSPPTAHAMQGTLGEADWRQQVHCEDRSMISQAFVAGNTFFTPGVMAPQLVELTAERLPTFLRAFPDRRVLGLERECIYLLATDGMWAYTVPQEFVRRWPGILHKPGTADLCHRLDDLFVEHILASASEATVDNSTAIALRVRR